MESLKDRFNRCCNWVGSQQDQCASCLIARRGIVGKVGIAMCRLFRFSYICFSPPVRWGLLDFMSATSPPSSPRFLPAPDGSVPHRTSTASSRWQCSHPDLNRELPMAVFPPEEPQPRAPNGSVPTRTSTASSVFPPGPQPQAPDGSVPHRTSTASPWWQFPTGPQAPNGSVPTGPHLLEYMSGRMSKYMSDRMSELMSDRMSECMSDRMSEVMPDRRLEFMSDTMSECMSDRMSESMSDRMSESTSEKRFGFLSDRVSAFMPDTVSENVMVGIPRSEVIVFMNLYDILFLSSMTVAIRPCVALWWQNTAFGDGPTQLMQGRFFWEHAFKGSYRQRWEVKPVFINWDLASRVETHPDEVEAKLKWGVFVLVGGWWWYKLTTMLTSHSYWRRRFVRQSCFKMCLWWLQIGCPSALWQSTCSRVCLFDSVCLHLASVGLTVGPMGFLRLRSSSKPAACDACPGVHPRISVATRSAWKSDAKLFKLCPR